MAGVWTTCVHLIPDCIRNLYKSRPPPSSDRSDWPHLHTISVRTVSSDCDCVRCYIAASEWRIFVGERRASPQIDKQIKY